MYLQPAPDMHPGFLTLKPQCRFCLMASERCESGEASDRWTSEAQGPLGNAHVLATPQAFVLLIQMFYYYAHQLLGNTGTNKPTFKTECFNF